MRDDLIKTTSIKTSKQYHFLICLEKKTNSKTQNLLPQRMD